MLRFTAGQSVSTTFTVTTGGTFSAKVIDGMGRDIPASVSETGGTATLTIASDAWRDNQGGRGMLEVRRVSGGSTSIAAREPFRILPGLAVEGATDYAG